jgi:hypothetical protein
VRETLDLREIGNLEPEGHWYYESKFRLIFKEVPKNFEPTRIIEIGAGSKFFIKKLLAQYQSAEGWAVDPNFSEEQLNKEYRLISCRSNPAIAGDMYLFLDVLEHVENDESLLTSSLSHAVSGALVVISVPAFMHLWSGHDEYLGHYRRYTINELRVIVERAGLEITNAYYIFSALYPLIYLFRKIRKKKIESDMKPIRSQSNSIFLRTLNLLANVNKNRFFGVSIVVIAKKR